MIETRTRNQFATAVMIASCGGLAMAYTCVGSLPLAASGLTVGAALVLRPNKELLPVDWAIVALLMLEGFAHLLFPPTGTSISSLLIIESSFLLYSLIRIVALGTRQYLTATLLVTAGGVHLAWFAIAEFGRHWQEIQANGLTDIVAFRYRLISPPPPWILGEWFTLLLMTLPFAFAATTYLWYARWRRLSAISLLPTLAIAAALMLSCSRAVFWGTCLFFVAMFAAGLYYRVFATRTAFVGAAIALCALVAIVLVENLVYPGVSEAYVGGQTSQSRSAVGRAAIWRRSFDVFRRSPLLGVGTGNTPLLLTATTDEEQTTGFASRTFSLPVQLLTEKGIVGTAPYLAVLFFAGWSAHQKLRSPKVSARMKGVLCCLGAGVLAILFRELTYSSLFEHAATAMLFAMMLALLATEEPE
jgi:O-antigen ligase